MAYIGNTVQNQGFTPAIDYFNGNGVTVTFTLSRPIASVAQVIVAVDNVIQNPSSAFGVVGNSITFTSAPLAGTNNIWVEYTSLITTYQGISQDPTVIGDIRATGGYLAEGDFGNSFVDGNLIDYVTGAGRLTVGELDDLVFYHGGTSARSEMMRLSYADNSYITGKLGIGNTTPYAKLQTYQSSSTLPVQYVYRGTQGSDGSLPTTYGYPYLQIGQKEYRVNSLQTIGFGYVSANGNNPPAEIGFLTTSTSGETLGALVFATRNVTTNTVASERMRISSAGYVTIPNQPAFSVKNPGSNTSGIQVFTVVFFNTGSHYNTSNGRFTAPIAGRYYFYFQGLAFSGNADVRYSVNGSTQSLNAESNESGYHQISLAQVFNLNANDYVQVDFATGTNYGLDYSSFCGYLIG